MSGLSEEAARLRVDLADAARLIAPVWPIDRFVAVNPLLGLVEKPFDEAVAEARRWFGAAGYPGDAPLGRALRDGQVAVGDLTAAVAARLPGLVEGSRRDVRGWRVHAATVVATDLLHGVGAAVPRVDPRCAAERFDAAHGTAVAPAVDSEVGRWCALLTRPGHDGSPGDRPGRAYARWRQVVRHERRARRLAGPGLARAVDDAPEAPDEAVLHALERLGVHPTERVDELRGQLARLPGWAGWAKWCDDWAGPEDLVPRISLMDLVAIRLTYEAEVLAHARTGRSGASPAPAVHPRPRVSGAAGGVTPRDRARAVLAALALDEPGEEILGWAERLVDSPTPAERGSTVLAALEAGHQDRLLRLLDRPPAPVGSPVAQVVFCIDVRSEGIRRHLEEAGPYDTLGFAGFFATPIRFRPVGSVESYPSAPVLIEPDVEIPEQGAPGSETATAQRVERRQARTTAERTVASLSHAPVSMFGIAEAGGWVLGPRALVRTLRPRARGERRPSTVVVVDRPDVPGVGLTGFELEERVLVAETALRTMGLTGGFAPLVVFCGHGSTTTANPHAAALDCGACGGNRGAPNARVAAAICNEPLVRDELRARGIDIPDGSWFVAAEHDTATDSVTVLDRGTVPATHGALVDRLSADLVRAGSANARDRLRRLPGARRSRSAERQVRARSGDWAEPRPEWGLARNAAFLVGSRDLTRGLDLDGRVFLHSYDTDADLDGTALETILTAPMVVAQWINAQYYFSTVDPDVFGAGDKTLHNPINGIGVLVGAGGDLRAGLPSQSVEDGEGPVHEPVRLLTLVEAPRDRIDGVIARNPILRHLFDGAWVRLVARDTPDTAWCTRLPDGAWVPILNRQAHSEGAAS